MMTAERPRSLIKKAEKIRSGFPSLLKKAEKIRAALLQVPVRKSAGAPARRHSLLKKAETVYGKLHKDSAQKPVRAAGRHSLLKKAEGIRIELPKKDSRADETTGIAPDEPFGVSDTSFDDSSGFPEIVTDEPDILPDEPSGLPDIPPDEPSEFPEAETEDQLPAISLDDLPEFPEEEPDDYLPAISPEDLLEHPAEEPEEVFISFPKKPEPVSADYALHTLEVSGLRKKFGPKEVVQGISFSMRNGEVAGLLGPNGAGKTTTFYMIVGFYRPTKGTVILDGKNITRKPMFRRARMGIAYLPQEASIFRKLTVEQNIKAILESRRDINRAAKKERLESLLEEFDIARVRKQHGYTLSGGERRRTEIARALATEPKFLLLDEPFAGIDPIAVFQIKQIIRRLAEKGIGILITDHNVRDTLEITTEAFIINDGTIVARGGKDEILSNKMAREVYLGSEFTM